MKVRAIKHRLSRAMGSRFKAPWHWGAADDMEWVEMAPIGREFGSSDFDRLMTLDEAAFSAFGSIARARQWLDTSNDQFGGLPPEEVTRSPEGWAKVMRLLKKADHTG